MLLWWTKSKLYFKFYLSNRGMTGWRCSWVGPAVGCSFELVVLPKIWVPIGRPAAGEFWRWGVSGEGCPLSWAGGSVCEYIEEEVHLRPHSRSYSSISQLVRWRGSLRMQSSCCMQKYPNISPVWDVQPQVPTSILFLFISTEPRQIGV